MKKNKLFNSSAIFLGISIVFTIIYDLLYAFFAEFGLVKGSMGIGSLSTVIPWIFTLIFSVILLIGAITQKKIFFILYFGYGIISSLLGTIRNVFYSIRFGAELYFHAIFSSLASVMFNIFMLILILAMFKWKEKLDAAERMMTLSNTKETEYNESKQADKLLEYKALLDIGAITPEEFETKKKEILN